MNDPMPTPGAENPDAEPEAQNLDANPDEVSDDQSVPADSDGEVSEGEQDGDDSVNHTDEESGKPDPNLAKLAYENRELRRQLSAREQQERSDRIQFLESELSNPKTLDDFDGSQRDYARYMAQLGPAAIELDRLKSQQQNPMGDPDVAGGGSDFAQAEVDFAIEHPDYYQRVYDPNATITREMATFVEQADNGVAILYHLATSPEEAAQIANLPPHAVNGAMKALQIRMKGTAAGGAEARGVAPGRGTGAGQQRRGSEVSNAPPPVDGLSGSGSPGRKKVSAKDPDSDKLSDAEWIKRRNQELSAKR